MQAAGNGTPQRCVDNLVRCFRGEVPYERVKGLDPRAIDSPIADARLSTEREAGWLIETYEPRVTVKDISVNATDPCSGEVSVSVTVDVK